MFFGLFWGDWTLLVVLPGVFLALYAQIKVKSTYHRYSSVLLRPGMTGGSVARRILDSNGLSHVRIETVPGELTDHYDPRAEVLRLSEANYHGGSVAAIGVAAHEAGHALQHGREYAPLKLRMAILPICNFGSQLAMPLFLIGLLLAYTSALGDMLMLVGIAAFSLTVLFQLITLPVEFNASRRAIRCLSGSGTMSDEELKGARRVLSAAAMTYVAALAVGLLSILRLLLIAGGRSRRR
ncbi:MAG: zinc metallopeptidase [Ruminococcaceae bacterium]|nr:zinc metallopeptidase [Oscillospiraceae bacterium]